MAWEKLVAAVTSRHPDLTQGKLFGMPCLKGADGKTVACHWIDGGLSVKIGHPEARKKALALPGATVGSHAFDPTRPMREWVHIPLARADDWERLMGYALD